MALVNLGIAAFLNGSVRAGPQWDRFSLYLSLRLKKAADELDDMGLPFEAATASDLSDCFARYHANDLTPESFVELWLDLEGFCDSRAFHEGSEKRLYRLPQLPDYYGC